MRKEACLRLMVLDTNKHDFYLFVCVLFSNNLTYLSLKFNLVFLSFASIMICQHDKTQKKKTFFVIIEKHFMSQFMRFW